MAELEEQPLPKEEIVEPAPVESSLTGKLLTLANKLHAAGFSKQAEDLEQTIALYKKAEQIELDLLYRAHSETGDDLLESAHPDGDVKMAPAQNDQGDVETLPSKHKKIIEIVHKNAQVNDSIKNIIIAQKFQLMADTINKNYLSATIDPVELQKNQKLQNFILYATKLYELAEKVIAAFNNAEESPRTAAFSRLNQIVNSQQFKFENIEDVDSYIETTLQTLAAGFPVKKASIVDMLKKSLNIKTAQIPPEQEQRKKSFDEFKTTVDEILSTINTVLYELFNNPKYDVKLDSGKTISEWKNEIGELVYKTKNAITSYNNYVLNNTVNDKSIATEPPYKLLQAVNKLADDLEHSIQSGKNVKIVDKGSKEKGLDSVSFPNNLKSRILSLQHLWFVFWGKYGEGNAKDLELHSQFLTPGKVIQLFNPQKVKLNSIKEYITKIMLPEPIIKASPPVSGYLNGMVKFIDGLLSNFTTITDNTQKFIEGDDGAFGNNKEITMNTIKEYITDKTLLNKLNFTSPDAFGKSLNEICTTLMNNLFKLVNENPIFDEYRKKIISGLEARKQTIFASP